MAEGYIRHFGNAQVDVYSAGIEAHGVNPRAIQVMKEDGIDISNHTSNTVEEFEGLKFDIVITVCDNANEHCPYFPGPARKFHQNFPDPAKANGSEEEIMIAFRQVRDEIEAYFKNFLKVEITLN
jgi:arsenate reductase